VDEVVSEGEIEILEIEIILCQAMQKIPIPIIKLKKE